MEDSSSEEISPLAEDDNQCKTHRQPFRYYCKKEERPICYDCITLKQCSHEHDHITIDDAVHNKTKKLEDLVKVSAPTLKKYKEAMKVTEAVGKELEIHSQLAKDALAKVEQDYINLVKKTMKRFEDEIETIKMERIQELDKKKTILKSTIEDFQRTTEDATRVIKSGSKIDMMATHATLSKQLQQFSESHLIAVDKLLGYVKFEAATTPSIPRIGQLLKDGTPGERWKLSGQFSTGDLHNLHGLEVNKDGHIAVCSWQKGVKVFSKTGQVKSTLYDSTGSICVAVLAENKYVTSPRGSQQIIICDSYGNQLSSTPITDMDSELSYANSITVDSNDKIIVGQVDNTISIHNADGSLISKFATQSMPYRLAATSNREIVSSFLDDTSFQHVELMDYMGGNVRVIQLPDEVKIWFPGFVCCRQGEIFVCNESSGEPKGVYRYTSDGDYLGCVTTEVETPKGIALSNDGTELFATERYDNCVKIFKRP